MGKGQDEHAQSSQETASEMKRPDRLLPTSLRAIASKARRCAMHRFRGLYSLFRTRIPRPLGGVRENWLCHFFIHVVARTSCEVLGNPRRTGVRRLSSRFRPKAEIRTTERSGVEALANPRALHGEDSLNRSNLRSAYFRLNRKATAGVDRVSHAEYGQDLDANVERLVEELQGKRYHAKLIRRAYIPKGPNTTRPLGILEISDKVVQRVASDVLSAIYEQDFADFSYAYRPRRDARKAVEAVRKGFMGSRCSWVVEFDIKGFYDNIDHGKLMEMLSQRVNDEPFLRLIRKWLRAGILDTDGKIIHPVTGTPQGGIVSCVLANVYLHHALDSWFERKFKQDCCRADAFMVRYADDWIAGFQYHADAAHFQRAVEERLKLFGLSLAKEKCSKKLFSRHRKRDEGRFDFPGFEFRWGRTRLGSNVVKVRTSRSRLRKSLANFKQWCGEHRNKRLKWIFNAVNPKLRGYYQYYGTTGNRNSLRQFFTQAKRILYRSLNRRSERKSYNWKTYQEMLNHYRLEQPRIYWGWNRQIELQLV